MDLEEAVRQITTVATEATEAARTASSSAARVETGLTSLRSLVVANHEATRQQHLVLRRDFDVLWRKVQGSDPPPGSPDAAPAEEAGAKPVADLAEEALRLGSHADAEVAELHGAVVAGFGAEARAREALREEVMTELKKQSTVLGVGVRGLFGFLKTREGRSFAAAMATTIAALAGILGTYAQVRSHVQAQPPTLPAPGGAR